MENKTTIELLQLLGKLEIKTLKGTATDNEWEEYREIIDELRGRELFSGIFGESEDMNDPTFEQRIDDIEDSVKKLKRHKHDTKTGDVLIRI